MKRPSFEQIIVGAVIVFVVGFVLLFAFAITRGQGETKKNINKAVPVKTQFSAYGYLYTVAHDGHLFVVSNGSDKTSLIHHPGCGCLTKGENE